MVTRALLTLADGSVFEGRSIGYSGETVGEVVFNTAMTGYQEILSDPSYTGQIITLTCPHIGNVGANLQDNEADKPWAAGLIIRDLPALASNYRKTEDLSSYLIRHKIVAIADIDTRRLTRILREKGALSGCITTNLDKEAAIAKARAFAGLNGMDLAKEVSTQKTYTWMEGGWAQNAYPSFSANQLPYHVVAYDYGVKQNILRCLVDVGCRVTVVPADTPAEQVIALNPDGVFLSNGPGDPAACHYAIKAIGQLLEKDIPIFGICLGHQLLGLACGAKTTKMKFGHHGANHPVQDLDNKKVMISSQNHGFVVEENSLPNTLRITHRSLFDNTIQGLHHQTKPAFSFQGHPEASPGPQDLKPLFNHFVALIEQSKRHAKTN